MAEGEFVNVLSGTLVLGNDGDETVLAAGGLRGVLEGNATATT